ncbi:hypothetical protein J22TS1_50260 [Siminovitchia terrae]|nr:hypothetical protein J22TS1_50260 [Siminovitchia terrae]
MGELALFSGSPFDHYAVAMENTELCVINRSDLKALLKKYPAISLKIMEEFSKRLERTEKLVSSLTSEDTEKRIAAYLVELAKNQESTSITLPAHTEKRHRLLFGDHSGNRKQEAGRVPGERLD